MNRNEAIERAAQAIIDKLDAGTGAGTTLGFMALREALAMPKADAERVALLAEVEDWMKPPTFGEDTPAWATLNRIRAYLQGGA
jgi:hypothetical protein